MRAFAASAQGHSALRTVSIISGRFSATGARQHRIQHGGCGPSLLTPGSFAHRLRGLDFSRKYSSIPQDEDTIYALSTPPGSSAIAVIRLSGPACVEVCKALCPDRKLPKPRYASVRTLYSPFVPPSVDTILDPEAMVLYFPGPKTVTGEDVLELHVHGGPATIKAVLAAIPECAAEQDRGAAAERLPIRYAQPGEFTRRAFANARLSLPQIEALSATLVAQTEQQRRIAARGSQSSLVDVYEGWRTRLLHARAELEALIDFSEDQHFDESPRELAASVAEVVGGLVEQMRLHRENAVRGEMMRGGMRVALLGAPNAGKSSLLNKIIGREAAIVSQEAGTTRDVVEVGVDLGGWLVKFGDTAGLRGGGSSTSGGQDVIGQIEQEGIRRAKERALQSDVVVVVLPLESGGKDAAPTLRIDSEVISTALECISNGRSIIIAINKLDKLSSDPTASAQLSAWKKSLQELLFLDNDSIFAISCKTGGNATTTEDESKSAGQGIQALLGGLTNTFAKLTQPLTPHTERDTSAARPALDMAIWQDSLGASERQRLLLEDCIGHLDMFISLAVGGAGHGAANSPSDGITEAELDVVIAAEALRAAAECLARITGRGEGGDVEEVLGVVFEK